MQTRGGSDPRRLLDEIAKRPVENEISFFFALYGFVLFIPAVMGVLHLLRHRAVALGHIGGGLLILGMVSFAYIVGTESLLYIVGADPTINRDALLAINNKIGIGVVYTIINFTELFGWVFGSIIIAIALFKEKVLPRIYSTLLIIGIILRTILAWSYPGTIISEILYFIAFEYLGFMVLGMSDREWERERY